jgi:hypothetical protein
MENNTEMDLIEVEWKSTDWIHLAWQALVNVVMDLLIP